MTSAIGPAGLGGACLLLLLEEAGVPLPFAPGEAVLVALGLLIASGQAPAWVVLPAAYVAVVAGSLIGYAWASRLGRSRLRGLAARIHATRAYDRAADRLVSAEAYEIGISRLIPGLRIYTTLVAGAVHLPIRRFIGGMLPAVALWVVAFACLGIFVGAPAAHLLGRLASWGLRIAELAVVLLAFYGATRWVPAVGSEPAREKGPRRRRILAEVVDGSVIILVVAALSLLTGLVGQDVDSFLSGFAIYGVLAVAYVVAARRSLGFTLGEMLLDVRYRVPR